MEPDRLIESDADLPPPQTRDATDSRRRRDAPGSLHHVTNRGVARRSIFETEAEIRFFLSLIARAVHKGWWRVHAFAVLHTHFHLLVEVRRQSLSRTMRWVLSRYARRFNCRRGREGPLFKSRFFSRPVRSINYRRIAVSYIDDNPVAAGLAPHSAAYPYSSARHHRTRSGPKWLDRSMVEGLMHDILGRPPNDEDYDLIFAGSRSPGRNWLVERRLQDDADEEDPLDDLLTAPTDRVRSWMVSRATLADGRDLRPPIATPYGIDRAIRQAKASNPDWTVQIDTRETHAWQVLHVGLLRDMAKLSAPEIAPYTSISVSQVYRRARQHRRLLAADSDYASRSAEALELALQNDQGGSL